MAGGGLPVRRHLPGARYRRRVGHADRQHRGHEPTSGTNIWNKHLAELSQWVSVRAIALLIRDGAGWHDSRRLVVPANIVLLPLPPYAPELNSVENIGNDLRGNFLSHCDWDSYEAILDACCDACCDAWNVLMATPDVIASIGTREWAKVKT
jgi:hypothetical protein